MLKELVKQNIITKLYAALAYLYVEASDFQKSRFVGESICRLLEKERYEADSLLLNIAWNIVGVSYFQLVSNNFLLCS